MSVPSSSPMSEDRLRELEAEMDEWQAISDASAAANSSVAASTQQQRPGLSAASPQLTKFTSHTGHSTPAASSSLTNTLSTPVTSNPSTTLPALSLSTTSSPSITPAASPYSPHISSSYASGSVSTTAASGPHSSVQRLYSLRSAAGSRTPVMLPSRPLPAGMGFASAQQVQALTVRTQPLNSPTGFATPNSQTLLASPSASGTTAHVQSLEAQLSALQRTLQSNLRNFDVELRKGQQYALEMLAAKLAAQQAKEAQTAAEDQAVSARGEATRAEDRAGQLTVELEAMKIEHPAAINKMQDQIAELRTRNKDLEAELSETKRQLQTYVLAEQQHELDRQSMLHQISQLRSEMENEQRQHTHQQQEAIHNIEARHQAADAATKAEHEARIAALKVANEADIAAAIERQVNQHNEKLQALHHQHSEKLASTAAALSASQNASLARTQEEHQAALLALGRKHAEELAQIQAESQAALKASGRQLASETADAQQREAQIKRLEAQCLQSQSTITELTSEMQTLQEQLKSSLERRKFGEEGLQRIGDLKQQLSDVESSTTMQIRQQKSQIQSLEQNVEELTAVRATLEERAQQNNKHIAEIEAQLGSLRKEHSAIQQDHTILQQQLHSQLATHTSAMKTLEATHANELKSMKSIHASELQAHTTMAELAKESANNASISHRTASTQDGQVIETLTQQKEQLYKELLEAKDSHASAMREAEYSARQAADNVTKLHAEISEAQRKIQELNSALVEAKLSSHHEVEATKRSAEQELHALRITTTSESSAATATKVALESQLETAREQSLRAGAQLTDLVDQQRAHVEASVKLQSKLERLQTEREQLEARSNQRIEEEVQAHNRTINELNEARAHSSERENQLLSMIAERDAELAARFSELDRLNEQFNSISQQEATVVPDDNTGRAVSLVEQCRKMSGELTNAHMLIAALERSTSNLQGQANKLEQINREQQSNFDVKWEEQEEEQEMLRNKARLAQEEVMELKQAAAVSAMNQQTLTSQIQLHQSTIKSLETHATSHMQQLSVLRQDLTAREASLLSTQEKLQTTVQEYAQFKTEVQSALSDLEKEMALKDTELNEREAEIDRLSLQLKTKTSEVDALLHQRSDLGKEVEKTISELEASLQQKEDALSDAERMIEQFEESAAQLRDLKTVHAENELKQGAHTEALNSSLQETEEELTTTRKQLTAMEAAHHSLLDQLSKLGHELEDEKRHHALASARETESSKRVDKLQSDANLSQEALQKLQVSFSALQAQYSTLQIERESERKLSEAEMKSLQTTHEAALHASTVKFESEIAQLQKKLADLPKAHEQDLSRFHEELSKAQQAAEKVLENVQATHSNQIKSLQTAHEQEIQSLDNKHEQAVLGKNLEFEKQLAKLKYEGDAAVQKLEQQVLTLTQDLRVKQAELDGASLKHEQALTLLQMEHANADVKKEQIVKLANMQYEQEIVSLDAKLNAMREQNDKDHTAYKERADQEIHNLVEKHQIELQTTVANAKSQQEMKENEWKVRFDSQEAQYAKWKSDLESESKRVRDEHSREVDRINSKHEDVLHRMREDRELDLRRAKNDTLEEITRVRQDRDEQLSQLRSDKDSEINALKSQAQQLRSELAATSARLQVLTGQLQAAEAAAKSSGKLDALFEENKNLAVATARTEFEMAQLKKDKSALEENVKSLTNDKNQFRSQLDNANANVRSLKEEQEQLQQSKKKLEQNLENAQGQCKLLETELAELKSSQGRTSDSLKTANESLERASSDLELASAQLRDTKSALASSEDRVRLLNLQQNDLMQTLADLKKSREDGDAKCEAAEKRASEAGATLAQVQTKITELEGALTAKNDELTKLRRDLDSISMERASVYEQLKWKEEEVVKVQAIADEAKSNLSHMEIEIAKMRDQVEQEAKTDIDLHVAENGRLQNMISQLESKNASDMEAAKVESEKLLQAHAEERKQWNAKETQIVQSHEKKLDEISRANVATQLRMDELNQKCKLTSSLLEKTQDTNQQLSLTVKELQASLSTKASNKYLSDEVEKSKHDVCKSEQALLQRSVESLQVEKSRLSDQIKRLESDNAALSAECARSRGEMQLRDKNAQMIKSPEVKTNSTQSYRSRPPPTNKDLFIPRSNSNNVVVAATAADPVPSTAASTPKSNSAPFIPSLQLQKIQPIDSNGGEQRAAAAAPLASNADGISSARDSISTISSRRSSLGTTPPDTDRSMLSDLEHATEPLPPVSVDQLDADIQLFVDEAELLSPSAANAIKPTKSLSSKKLTEASRNLLAELDEVPKLPSLPPSLPRTPSHSSGVNGRGTAAAAQAAAALQFPFAARISSGGRGRKSQQSSIASSPPDSSRSMQQPDRIDHDIQALIDEAAQPTAKANSSRAIVPPLPIASLLNQQQPPHQQQSQAIPNGVLSAENSARNRQLDRDIAAFETDL